MDCKEPSQVKEIATGLGLGYSFLEYWIGKTDKVKSNSVIEMLLNGLKVVFRFATNKEDKMLEGKELEGKIGDVGSYSVDATAEGKVIISIEAKKEVEGVVLKSANSVEVGLLFLLEKYVKSTSQTWDDALVDQLSALLGLKK